MAFGLAVDFGVVIAVRVGTSTCAPLISGVRGSAIGEPILLFTAVEVGVAVGIAEFVGDAEVVGDEVVEGRGVAEFFGDEVAEGVAELVGLGLLLLLVELTGEGWEVGEL